MAFPGMNLNSDRHAAKEEQKEKTILPNHIFHSQMEGQLIMNMTFQCWRPYIEGLPITFLREIAFMRGDQHDLCFILNGIKRDLSDTTAAKVMMRELSEKEYDDLSSKERRAARWWKFYMNEYRISVTAYRKFLEELHKGGYTDVPIVWPTDISHYEWLKLFGNLDAWESHFRTLSFKGDDPDPKQVDAFLQRQEKACSSGAVFSIGGLQNPEVAKEKAASIIKRRKYALDYLNSKAAKRRAKWFASELDACSNCGKLKRNSPTRFFFCAACKATGERSVTYCSPQCQKEHWSKHKPECMKFRCRLCHKKTKSKCSDCKLFRYCQDCRESNANVHEFCKPADKW